MGELLAAWILAPLVVVALAGGCGMFLEWVSGTRIPGTLLVPLGIAGLIVIGELTTSTDATAELTVPAAVAVAVAGSLLSPRFIGARDFGWPLAAAVSAFAAFAAPVVLSGEATFAGYIKLDDTATWFALTDRVMEHGPTFGGLAPSSYEATLAVNLGAGYPTGAFPPLGIASTLTGIDVAWVFQPFLAVLAACLALTFFELAKGILRSAPTRGLIAFIACQPALLFGYAMWGGIKELEATLLVATAAAFMPIVISGRHTFRAVLPVAVCASALLAIFGVAGGAWLLALLVPAAAAFTAVWGRAATLRAFAVVALAAALLSLPLLGVGRFFSPTQAGLTGAAELGNLGHPLGLDQLAGIWPAGDFRLDPKAPLLTHLAIAIAFIGAAGGFIVAFRARAIGMLTFAVAALGGFLFISALGSPWVDAKAMVTGSTAVLLLALTAAAWLWREGRRPPALLLAAPIVIGVLASNVLAYREVNLAPRDQLAELEDIGSQIAGQGPTLMTEYQPYGVRHFLRDADPEGASELRRRQVLLRDGGTLDKGGYADTDEIALADLLVYRTLVLRRSPVQSRPPSPYRLIDRGDYYTVWQRPEGDATVIDHLPLGNAVDPAAIPDCDDVRALAAGAPPGAKLLAIPRGPVIVLQSDQLAAPPAWHRSDDPTYLYPEQRGEADATFMADTPGRVGVWLGGSVRDRLETRLNGQSIGTVRDKLNNFGQYVRLGDAEVKAGPNSLRLLYDGPDLAPGSAGDVYPAGPLIVAPDDIDSTIKSVPADRATTLCGKRWDWIELVA